MNLVARQNSVQQAFMTGSSSCHYADPDRYVLTMVAVLDVLVVLVELVAVIVLVVLARGQYRKHVVVSVPGLRATHLHSCG